MPQMTRAEIDAALLAAYERGDKAAISTLYIHAAEAAQSDHETAFFLTQAYVFALDAGDPGAATLQARLRTLGAEH